MAFAIYYLKNEHFTGVAPASPNPERYDFIASLANLDHHDDVFRPMNVVDGTELPVRLKVRSMSCGDIVVDMKTSKAWVCADFGWGELPSDFAEKLPPATGLHNFIIK